MASPKAGSLGLLLLTALALSVGWGIRGNFGHEYGAMIPGALATMGAVLLSGRSDWWPRIGYFGFFGAMGWSFGGSISYMQVIAYTHSGHSSSVLYGFACLFVIGFLWAAMGGAGAGLAACLDRDRLSEFFIPLTAVFASWQLQDVLAFYVEPADSQFRQASPLYWYDTDWLAALAALFAVGTTALFRRRVDSASSLIIHLAVGWWIGFLGMVVGLGWRMTPPRGDNWAGCVGMVLGLWFYLRRQRLFAVLYASILTGFAGGLGFAGATLCKLVSLQTGWQTNWHSALEQTYGLFNGVGLGLSMLFLARQVPPAINEPRKERWTEIYAVLFVLIGITYLNLRKNPPTWVEAKAMPAELLGLSAATWFDLAYLLITLSAALLLAMHQRRRIPMVPETSLGRGQLLFLVFLWWIVVGNFGRAVVGFAPQRLVTEGIIHLNAVLCTLLVLGCRPREAWPPAVSGIDEIRKRLGRLAAIGASVALLGLIADWAIVRACYGDTFAGQAALHIRFGPNATATKVKPVSSQPHP